MLRISLVALPNLCTPTAQAREPSVAAKLQDAGNSPELTCNASSAFRFWKTYYSFFRFFLNRRSRPPSAARVLFVLDNLAPNS